MTAATKDRDTRELASPKTRQFPMAANAKVFGGTMAAVDASGNVTKGATSTTLKCVGIFPRSYDNTGGAAGDVKADTVQGVFGPFANSASTDQLTNADVGQPCYMVDDQTVAKTNGTNTRSVAGALYLVDTAGVWVRFS